MSKKNRGKRQIADDNVKNTTDMAEINRASSSKWKLTLALLVIIITTIVTYRNSLDGEFHFDDVTKIVENPDIRTLRGVFIDGPKRAEPRMVSNFTLYLNYKFDGYNVRYYHAFNIGLHIINCVLIYFVVLLLLHRVGIDKRYLAFLASLFFALHPVNTEPLNYIVHGRFIMLCAMFYLLGMLFFILAFEAGRRKWLYLTLCFISYILSIFSKEVGITLPGVLFCYYLYFICDSRKAFLKAVTLFGVAMALVIIYAMWYGMPGIIKIRIPEEAASPFVALMVEWLTQLNVATIYLKLYILPLPSFLNVDHYVQLIPHSPDLSSFQLDAQTIFSIIVIAGLISAAIITYKKHRLIFFSLMYLFITHSPTTLPTRKGEIIAEYKNYLPFFGFAFLAMLCLSEIFSYLKLGKKAVVSAALIIAALFSFADIGRNRVWKNNFTLWGDSVEKVPDNVRAHVLLSDAYLAEGNYDMALSEGKKALEICQKDRRAYLAYIATGVADVYKKNYDEAEHYLNEALKFPLDVRLKSKVYCCLGILYGEKGDYPKSFSNFESALKEFPDVGVYQKYGYYCMKSGQHEKMKELLEKVIELDPANAGAYITLGNLLLDSGNVEGAKDMFDKGLAINPSDEDAYLTIGANFSYKKVYDAAEYYYKKALSKNYGFGRVHYELAKVYVKKREYDRAIEYFNKALEFSLEEGDKLQIRKQIEEIQRMK